MNLPSSQKKLDRISQGIYNSVNFCSFSTAACSNKLIVF